LLYFDKVVLLVLVERGDSVDVLHALDQLSDVIASNGLHRGALLNLAAMAHGSGVGLASDTGSVVGVFVILAFDLDVFVNIDASVHEILLGKHSLEDGLTISYVNSMEVLSLNLLFSHDQGPIEGAQLWDVEQDLQAEVLFVLNGVVAHLKFSQQRQLLDKSQLQNFGDAVEGDVAES